MALGLFVLSDLGHFMSLVESSVRKSYSARLKTPFFNTTGKCLMLAYRFLGHADGILTVISRSEDLRETVIEKIIGESVRIDKSLNKIHASL